MVLVLLLETGWRIEYEYEYRRWLSTSTRMQQIASTNVQTSVAFDEKCQNLDDFRDESTLEKQSPSSTDTAMALTLAWFYYVSRPTLCITDPRRARSVRKVAAAPRVFALEFWALWQIKSRRNVRLWLKSGPLRPFDELQIRAERKPRTSACTTLHLRMVKPVAANAFVAFLFVTFRGFE
jgi:hypothetical protein